MTSPHPPRRSRAARLAASITATAAALLLFAVPRASAQATKHIFYRVAGPNGATVYLLGSVHLLPAEAATLPPAVDSAFTRAKAIVFETSLDSLETRAGELLARAQYGGDTTLRTALSPAAVPKAEAILASYGASLEKVAHFKPWFVSLALQQAVAQSARFEAQYGVDAQLNSRAKAAGKPRLSLETVSFQLGLFDRMTPAQQESELLATKSPAEALRELLTMEELWLSGNAAGLDSLTHAGETSATAAITGAVLASRNQTWLPKVVGWVEGRDDMLVVVGAGHLVGAQGLVELLRAKGFKVEQL